MSSPGLPGTRKTLKARECLVEYHCSGQGAGALAPKGEAEGTGFDRPKEKKAKWDLNAIFHYIKAVKTEPDSPQSCTEGT